MVPVPESRLFLWKWGGGVYQVNDHGLLKNSTQLKEFMIYGQSREGLSLRQRVWYVQGAARRLLWLEWKWHGIYSKSDGEPWCGEVSRGGVWPDFWLRATRAAVWQQIVGLSGGWDPSFEALVGVQGRGVGVSDEGGSSRAVEKWIHWGYIWMMELTGWGKAPEEDCSTLEQHIRR